MSSDIAVRREVGLLATVDEVVHDLDKVETFLVAEQVDERDVVLDTGTLVLKNTIKVGEGEEQEFLVSSRLLDNLSENPDDILATLLVL